jgi:hypothetical protein
VVPASIDLYNKEKRYIMESVSGSLRIPTLEEATTLERIANATARYAVQVRAWAVEDNTPDSLHTYKEAKLQHVDARERADNCWDLFWSAEHPDVEVTHPDV